MNYLSLKFLSLSNPHMREVVEGHFYYLKLCPRMFPAATQESMHAKIRKDQLIHGLISSFRVEYTRRSKRVHNRQTANSRYRTF